MILFVPANSLCVAGATQRSVADAARNVHIAFASSLHGNDVVKYHAAAAVRVALLKNRVALLACSCAKHSQKDSTRARSSAVVATAIASRAVMVPPLSGLQLAATALPGRSAGSDVDRPELLQLRVRYALAAHRARCNHLCCRLDIRPLPQARAVERVATAEQHLRRGLELLAADDTRLTRRVTVSRDGRDVLPLRRRQLRLRRLREAHPLREGERGHERGRWVSICWGHVRDASVGDLTIG